MSKSNNENSNNSTISYELVTDKNGAYISEVQTFNKPVDYETAFKKYYPENIK